MIEKENSIFFAAVSHLPSLHAFLEIMGSLVLYLSDYIQCEYCERRFNPTAADRHIKFCKEQHLRMSRKVGNKAANKPKPKPQVSVTQSSNTKLVKQKKK